MTEQAGDETARARPRVSLIGTDGNAYAVLGAVFRALREAGWTQEERDALKAEAIAGGYDDLLRTVMKHVDVE